MSRGSLFLIFFSFTENLIAVSVHGLGHWQECCTERRSCNADSGVVQKLHFWGEVTVLYLVKGVGWCAEGQWGICFASHCLSSPFLFCRLFWNPLIHTEGLGMVARVGDCLCPWDGQGAAVCSSTRLKSVSKCAQLVAFSLCNKTEALCIKQCAQLPF